jgi:hypothetical protein
LSTNDSVDNLNLASTIGSGEWPKPTTPEDNYCPLNKDVLDIRRGGIFTNVRRYYLKYSPKIVVTYRTRERNNELIIRETVRYRWLPCFKAYVPMPGETHIDDMRKQEGIAPGDAIGFPERNGVYVDSLWASSKLLRRILFNFLPFWWCEWRYPLPEPD